MPADITMFCMAATPFREDGSLDEDSLRVHLRRIADAGNGVYLGSGGAGEGHVLTTAELRRIYEIGVEVCGGSVPVYANPRESRSAAAMYEVAREAVAAGVDVVQIYQLDAGHGMIPTLREQEAYFAELLAELHHPLAISVHAYAGYAAPPSLLAALVREHPQVCAVNVMGPPTSYFMEVRDALPDSVRMYTSVLNVLQGLALGASGALLAENNVIPNVCRRIADGWATRDLDMAGEAARTVQRFSNVVNRWAPSTARWVKMALKVLDLPAGNGVLRRPYLLPPESEQREMLHALEGLHIREAEGLTAAIA
ncbi:MAG TPA: dihydrodipicolinate synthase family protein [Candidatus Dormibacteraeota bacterium]|jgi:4-hydroxy-tetrahydrodipicolinate synthase|nr:dihydrodipicolinate synthase family protein [Candidatus Dormibacteraeota bacterium]